MKRIGKVLLYLLIVVLGLAGTLLGFLTIRHREARTQVEREWQAVQVTRIPDLGTTRSLEIIPLVDEGVASRSEFQVEHGVSYLIKTDETTILFDVGQNVNATDPSPLQANMEQLGIRLDDVQMVVISHDHPDHTGGMKWWRAGTFSLGNEQVDLKGKTVYVPNALTYPQLTPVVADQPQKIAKGVASLGTIAFAEVWQLALFQSRNVEQALAVNVEGSGIVIISGCGHQTLPKLVERTQALFDEPIAGVVGGLHYENADAQAVEPDIEIFRALRPQLIALSPHDSEGAARQAFRDTFPGIYQDVMVGRPIQFGTPFAHYGATK
jgi:7,8-dihydropterin-6-yl-methyl-4-(beta-D-ribofuranosyl)aminobenzene 5'-phosphate synthase